MNDSNKDNNNQNKPPAPKVPRGLILWVLVFALMLLLVQALLTQSENTKNATISDLKKHIRNNQVKKIVKKGNEYSWTLVDGVPADEKNTFYAKGPDPITDSLDQLIDDHEKDGLKLVYENTPIWITALLSMIPWLLLLVFIWFFLFRQMRSSSGSLLSFGKSRAVEVSKQKVKKTFKDVAGIEEAKEEVEEIVDFLKNPGRYHKLGGRIPRGVMLIGPPGTGKTLLAKAIAGEAGVPFFSISGSDFVEMFVGVGASRVRDLFQQAKSTSPCIIFLDEVDAVGRKRGSGLGGGHDEREQTLNAILVEMDGFESDENIIVMAATNRPDVLDPALLRPGRFDRRIYVDLPDIKGREDILKVHARKIKMGKDAELSRIAKGTPMFAGADLENLINEAALIAGKADKKSVGMDDLEEARDKVWWGKEKKSRVMDTEDKKITAYHEAGHAIVGMYISKVDPLHKITIIPRGRALGATMYLPDKDQYNISREKLLGQIAMALGGRISEEIFCDDISTGASNDIEKATQIARNMVVSWGMSTDVGPINYSESEERIFIGGSIRHNRDYSEETSQSLDHEISKIIKAQYELARKIIVEHKDEVEKIFDALMEREVLSAEEIEVIIGHKLNQDQDSDPEETEDEHDDSLAQESTFRPDDPMPDTPGISPSPA